MSTWVVLFQNVYYRFALTASDSGTLCALRHLKYKAYSKEVCDLRHNKIVNAFVLYCIAQLLPLSKRAPFHVR